MRVGISGNGSTNGNQGVQRSSAWQTRGLRKRGLGGHPKWHIEPLVRLFNSWSISMKRRGILVIAALIGATILALITIPGRETQSLDVSGPAVRTNENRIVFSITNTSLAPVNYWIGLAQVKSNGVWLRAHITADDGVLPPPAVLTAAAEVRAIVDAPSSDAETRLPVFWQFQGKKVNLYGVLRFNWRIQKIWWPHRQQTPWPKIVMKGDEFIRISYSGTVPK